MYRITNFSLFELKRIVPIKEFQLEISKQHYLDSNEKQQIFYTIIT